MLLRPAPLRPVPALALRVLAAALRPARLLVVPLRPFPSPVRLLPAAFLLRPLLLAVRSLRVALRSVRLPALPRAFRELRVGRSFEAVRVRAVERGSLVAAASWSIRCPASLVQLCEGTPRALSWRAKLFAAASFGNGPTSMRLGPA